MVHIPEKCVKDEKREREREVQTRAPFSPTLFDNPEYTGHYNHIKLGSH